MANITPKKVSAHPLVLLAVRRELDFPFSRFPFLQNLRQRHVKHSQEDAEGAALGVPSAVNQEEFCFDP